MKFKSFEVRGSYHSTSLSTKFDTLYVTAYLEGCHGTAKSAKDFLLALLACQDKVIVLGPNRLDIPARVGPYRLSRPEWLVTRLERRYRRRILRYWLTLPEKIGHLLKRKLFLRRLNAQGHPMVIVNGWASLEYWQKYASHLALKKFLVVRESPRHFTWGDCQVDFDLMLDTLAQFNGLIFVSDKGRQEWLGYPELKSMSNFYLPNCCEEEETQALLQETRSDVREKLGLQPEEFIIICPGTIEKRKGQDLVFDILPELIRLVPRLRLLFVGGAGTPWGRQFTEKLLNGPFSDHITHWHFRESILDAIYASDLLVFPSRAEAFPRTILEAMALKTPIVASDVDGIPEQIEDKKTGYLFHAGDKAELLRALTDAVSHDRRRSDMANAGFKKYWDSFSRQQQIKHMSELMTTLARDC